MVISTSILHKTHYGFVRERSIWNNILQVQNVLQTRNLKNAGYLLLLEIEKAYYRVTWPFLYNAMQAVNIQGSWLDACYIVRGAQNPSYCKKGLTGSIPVSHKLRRGDPMSPILFKFSAKILLVASNRIPTVLKYLVQWTVKAIAFAENTVVELGCKMYVVKALLVIPCTRRRQTQKKIPKKQGLQEWVPQTSSPQKG